MENKISSIFKLLIVASCIAISLISCEENAKYIELQPLEIQNLTDITYKKEEIKLDDDLQKDLDEIYLVKNRTKTAACMLILRTNLNRGNEQVKKTIKESKHDKEVTYDKIIANMLDTCHKNIDEKTIEKILKPENINLWEDSFEELLKFEKNVFQIIGPQPKLTPSEQFIKNDIENVIKHPGIEIPVEEEKVDFLTEKLGKYKYMAYGSTVGFTISFVFILFYNLFLKK